ncbi:tail fiber domain-containing protein [Limosilactobacillus fermentum]|uniref:tail fiber domain-containing protein n=1 Tax=Limosilactobacillus fermentum TaxID=1613 RepID=UPI003359CBA7
MLYRQIILEWGQDTESGVWGLGYSPDNGKNFYVLNTTHGRKYRAEDGNRLYPYISDQVQDKIETVVAPAKSAADSAVAYANDAIEKSRVNSQAIDDINSAVSDAASAAAVARSDGLRAWNAAQSNVNLIDLNYASASASISSARTEAIAAANEAKASASAAQADIVAVRSDVAAVQAEVTGFDPLLKSAQSDAGKALAQIADTANTLSETKVALTSDVAVAKNLANAAQTTANNAVESAGENAKALTSQANALSDARKAMDSDIANAKELANAAQTTADSAVKSASSVANDLAAVASQTKANTNGITKVTSDVGLLQTTVADNSGNISTIQETTKQIQQAVSDNAGNITVAKQTADSAATVASDAKSNATVAVQTASGASVTAKNAQGDATTAMTTANSAVIQASDAKSNATIAVQTASEASLTATNAQGDASIAKQTASEASVQIKNAQGDISKLQTRAGTIEASVANNSGAIADVQATANQLKASVSDNSGAIVVTTQTAQGAATVASDAKSNATVAIQTASQASITAKNASGQAASAVLTANGAMTTASDAKSNATVAVQKASGASLTATNANSDATVAKQTASEAKVQASNAKSDFAQLSIRANKIEANVADNSGAIASVQQTANGLTTTVGNVDNRVKTIEDKTNWTTKTGPLDMNTLTTTQNIYYRDSKLKNADGETGWAYIQVVSMGERVTQTVWHDRSSIQHTRTGAVSGSSYNWDAWNTVATNAQVVQVKQTVDGIATTINDPKTGLNATYQTAAGNATTISNAQGDIAKLKTRADGFDAELADTNGDISKLQTDASGTKQTLTNAKNDIAVLQSRADGFDTKFADAAGDINTLKANASGFSQTLVSAKGDISTLQSTANGFKNTLTDAQGNISTLQSDVSGLKKTTSDNAGNISTLQATANTLTSQMSSAQGDISTLKQTASGISSQVSGLSDRAMQNRGTVDSPDFNSLTQAGYYTITSPANGKNYPTGSWGTLEVSGQVTDNNGRLNQKYVSDNNGTAYTRQYNANTKGWTAWVKVANQNDIDTLNGKITANTTAIEQNKNAITLKADQTDVNTLKGNVTSLQAEVTTQANEITTKVTQSDVTGMLTGYATQDYTQSLVTQKANDWNLNLTSLKTDVNAIRTNGGGVNLLQGTRDFSGSNWLNLGTIWTKTDETYNGLSVVETTDDWSGIAQYYQVKQGETYIFSLFARYTSGTGTSNFYIGLNSNPENGYKNAQVDNGVLTCSLDTNWKKYSITFTAKADGYVKPRMERTNANTNPLRVCGFMLEKGTVAHDWSPAPSDMATVTSVTNLSATVDGIKSTVANYQTDTSSHFTQLSNLIQSKVGTDDFNSLKQTVGLQTLESADIDSMNKNGHYFVHNLTNSPISGWVYVDITGNGIDRIRQDVYQDTGTKHKYRRWFGTSFTDWEEGATYTEINQLQDAINLRVTKGDLISQINLQAGTALIQSNKLVLDGKTTIITGEAFIPSAAISSIQADKIQIGNSQLFSDDGTFNLINQNAGTSSIKLTTGNVQGSTQPVTKFANGYNTSAIDISPVGTVIRPTLFFEDYPGQAKDTGWLGFSRHQTAELYFHTYDDTKELFRVACVSRFNQELHVDKPIWQQGLSIAAGNTIWSGSNFLAIGDHISNSYTNVMARSFSQQSTLSAKTNIETVDPKDALDLVNQTDIRSYQYKSDVAQGNTKRYTSLIIDDVNDVSKYYAPDEFINEERTGRDDGSAVGYLFLAVKELTRRIKNLEEKLNG